MSKLIPMKYVYAIASTSKLGPGKLGPLLR